MSVKKIIQEINKSKNILILSHVNADVDAICSELVIARYLRSKNKKVTIINNEKIPARFLFLPGAKHIKEYKKNVKVKSDLVIIVDSGDMHRIGKTKNLISRQTIINIDHHATNTFFGQLNLVIPTASSAAEVVYTLLKSDGYKITDNIAKCLYSGIMTDTGSFRYENTSYKTHYVAGELMKYKFSAYKLYQHFYDNIPIRDLRLFSKLVAGFKTLYSNKVIFIELTKRIFARFSDEFDLKDAIFRYFRSIKGVELIIIFTEQSKNETRANLRSANKVNVAKLANKFMGGGHKRASGCTIKKGLKESRKLMLREIKKVL